MNREQFLTIDLNIKDASLYYQGTIYEPYNLFFEIKMHNSPSETFQVTHTDMKREPIGKFSGAIELKKGKNEVALVIRDDTNKEIHRELHRFII